MSDLPRGAETRRTFTGRLTSDNAAMKYIAPISLAVTLAFATVGYAQTRTATNEERERCEAPIERQIDDINNRMREGYSAREGEMLKERLRNLQDQKARCRTK
jgi:hypothetical protein